MATILRANNITKKYGRKIVLDNISFEVNEGEVLGILGPNGCGKTTLIKIISTFIQKTSGELTICGESAGVHSKSKVSYLPDRNFLPKWMKIKDAKKYYLDFFEDFNPTTFDDMMQMMELDMSFRVSELSKGMLEKLNLSLILSRDASLYVLDEPIGGVDIIARDMILNTIIDKAFEKKTMIISTHLIGEIENIFDKIIILKDGKIALEGNVSELKDEKEKSVEEMFREIYGGINV